MSDSQRRRKTLNSNQLYSASKWPWGHIPRRSWVNSLNPRQNSNAVFQFSIYNPLAYLYLYFSLFYQYIFLSRIYSRRKIKSYLLYSSQWYLNVYTQPLRHELDATLGQFLSGVHWFEISFLLVDWSPYQG